MATHRLRGNSADTVAFGRRCYKRFVTWGQGERERDAGALELRHLSRCRACAARSLPTNRITCNTHAALTSIEMHESLNWTRRASVSGIKTPTRSAAIIKCCVSIAMHQRCAAQLCEAWQNMSEKIVLLLASRSSVRSRCTALCEWSW